MKKIILLVLAMFWFSAGDVWGVNTITVNPSTTYQTFTGWEVVPFLGEPGYSPYGGYPSTTLPLYRPVILSSLVNDYGANRVRLEVSPGLENPNDLYANYLADPFSTTCRNAVCHANQWWWVHVDSKTVVDDDSRITLSPRDPQSVGRWITQNPSSADVPGFQFHSLDHKIEEVVNPFRQALATKGETLQVNLTYVAFGTSNLFQYIDQLEYAEFMLATLRHLDKKYGVVPETIEIELEPDNVLSFTKTDMGEAIVETEKMLAFHGYHPKFVVPCTTSMANASVWFDGIAQYLNPNNQSGVVSRYIKEICYHRYQGVSDTELQNISSRAVNNNIGSSMLECWPESNCFVDYRKLFDDLTKGRNTAWQENAMLALFDVAAPYDASGVKMKERTKFISQYTKYIRPGAVRIGATAPSGYSSVAFINSVSKYVVVTIIPVKSSTFDNSFSIGGFPAGTYGISYVTNDISASPTNWRGSMADQTVTTGQAVNVPGIWANGVGGVVTVFGKTAGPTPTPTPSPIGTGDVNADGSKNTLDLKAVLAGYLKAVTTALNQYGVDAKINALDFVVVLKRLP